MRQFKKPSRGNKPDKIFRDALMIALRRQKEGPGGIMTQKISLIADVLVDKAAGGDLDAIREIANRVDGKPAVERNEPSPVIIEMGGMREKLEKKLDRIAAAERQRETPEETE